jgi:hypothetical protein
MLSSISRATACTFSVSVEVGAGSFRIWSARLILQRPAAEHVVDALLHRLDVPVEHRDVGPETQPVGRAMNRQVAIRAALVVADLLPHPLGEDLGAAARQGIEPGRHQLDEHLLVRHAVEVREECDLDGGEALQMDARSHALHPGQHLRVVAERQIGMEAVDDVNLGQRLVRAAPQLVPRFLEAHRVRQRRADLKA